MFKPIVVEVDGERYDFREVIEFKANSEQVPPTVIVKMFGGEPRKLEGLPAKTLSELFKQYVLYGV